jgi:RNA polymerase sigma factor (sigma-70 family)
MALGEEFDTVLAAAQVGAGWGCERLWTAYAGMVGGYLRLQGMRDPDGLANEVFFHAFRSLAGFDGTEDRFRSWLFTIAHRRVIDERRFAARRPQLAEREYVEEPAGPSAEDVALQRASEQRVRALCQELVPDQQDVLLLRLVAGLTIEEIATALGKSPGAVKALQRRGLAALRRILEQEAVPL